MRFRLTNPRYGFLLNVPGLLIVLLWVVFPAVLLFCVSFLRYDNVHPVTFTGLGNYQRLWDSRVFWISVERIILFSLGSTALTFLGGMVLALSLSNIQKGGGLLRSLMIIPWAVPAVVSGLVWKWMFSPDFGVISDLLMKAGFIGKPLSIYSHASLAMWGVIIADSWTRIPFMGIILLAALLSIPEQIHEAARVDGAGTLSRFAYITLPMIRGPLLVGLMITTIFSFRTIDIIIPLTSGGPGRATYVLGYFIWDQITKSLNFGVGAAAGTVLFLVTSVITLVFVYLLRK
ncbi:MAG TPA: sugar ABC transporter permease [Candidatus Methylomirabilis sp.]|nr:sugar ABC transporter permease [Candidatus Methylomirabilis sp.]